MSSRLWRWWPASIVIVAVAFGYFVWIKARPYFQDSWETYPMATMPDRTCRIGGVGGYDVYIWNCIAGERVVIHRFTGDMFAMSEAKRETTACGDLSDFELSHPFDTESCAPNRGRTWLVDP